MATEELIISPLIKSFQDLGFEPAGSNGFRHYNYFTDAAEEYETLHKAVGLKDMSGRTIIEFMGKDVLSFINRLSTNRLEDVKANQAVRTCFTNPRGGLLECAQVFNFFGLQLCLGHRGTKSKLAGWINKYLMDEDVKLNDGSGKYAVFDLIGPQAESFLILLFGKEQTANLKEDTIVLLQFDEMSFNVLKLEEGPGNYKFRIITEPDKADKLIKYSVENKGVFDFKLIGEKAYNIFKIEHLKLSAGELTPSFTPFDAGLGSYVDLTKQAFLGKDNLVKAEKQSGYCLSAFKAEGELTEGTKYNIYDKNGEECGRFTSFEMSFNGGNFYGLGYIKKELCKTGAEYDLKNKEGDTAACRVIDTPFKAE